MTVCDELMGNALHYIAGIDIVTTSMRTRFISPVRVGQPYLGVAAVDRRSGLTRLYQTTAKILDASGDLAVIASATYHCLVRGDKKGQQQ